MTEEKITVRGHHFQSFGRKQIGVTFYLVEQDGSERTLTLEPGHRIRATISHAGMQIGSELGLTIEGMDAGDMARLSHVGNITNEDRPNLRDQSSTTIAIRAGDEGTVLPTVFYGMLTESYASFNNGSATFNVKAITVGGLITTKPSSYSRPGARLVLELLEELCEREHIRVIDHGGWHVNQVLYNHYSNGTLLTHITSITEAVGATFKYNPLIHTKDDLTTHKNKKVIGTGLLHVWGPAYRETYAQDTRTPLVSAHSGMIGYPDYSLYGIKFSCLFRPDISFYAPIKIKSNQMPAGWELQKDKPVNQDGQRIQNPNHPYDGLWLPTFISHDLSAEIPNGPWSSNIECQRTDVSTVYAYPKP